MDDGGAAFPIGSGQTPQQGLSKLDWFAGLAMREIMRNDPDDTLTEDFIARESYVIAGAMIEARKEGNDE